LNFGVLAHFKLHPSKNEDFGGAEYLGTAALIGRMFSNLETKLKHEETKPYVLYPKDYIYTSMNPNGRSDRSCEQRAWTQANYLPYWSFLWNIY
jgi:hypothetical protein